MRICDHAVDCDQAGCRIYNLNDEGEIEGYCIHRSIRVTNSLSKSSTNAAIGALELAVDALNHWSALTIHGPWPESRITYSCFTIAGVREIIGHLFRARDALCGVGDGHQNQEE